MLETLSGGQWAILLFTAFLYGFGKTGILGSAVITTPILLVLFKPGDVIGITLPLLVMADIGALLLLRRSANRKHVISALPWAFIGIVLGWLFARYTVSLPDEGGDVLLRKTIAAMLLFLICFGILTRLRPGIVMPAQKTIDDNVAGTAPESSQRTRSWFVILMGILGGITTMLANNGGPAWVVYLMNLNLSVHEFLGTAAWLFFFQNVTKLPFAFSLGFIGMDTLRLSLYLIPAVAAGLATGIRIVKYLPKKLFENLTQGAALIGALYILLS